MINVILIIKLIRSTVEMKEKHYREGNYHLLIGKSRFIQSNNNEKGLLI